MKDRDLKPFTVHLMGMVSESYNVMAGSEADAERVALRQADEEFPDLDVSWDSTSTSVFEGHDQ